MNELETLLGADLYKQVEAKLAGKQVIVHDSTVKYVVDDGNFIPKHRFDEVNQSKKALQVQVEQYTADLVKLKDAAKGNEELTSQIAKMKEDSAKAIEELSQKEVNLRKQFAIKESLLKTGVIDPEARDLLSLKFDINKIELNDDGSVKEFDSLIKPIKENKSLSTLFGEVKISGQQHHSGGNPTPLNELQAQLADAEKAGNTLQVITLTRMISEQNQADKNNS
jgi:hypothetical protein